MQVNENVINWANVICQVIWIVVVLILIPLYKKVKPIVMNYLTQKMGAANLQIVMNMLSDLIISAEKNIVGPKMGSNRKEFILNLLKEYGLVNESNKDIVSNLIDGLCEQLTKEELINTTK